MKDFPSFFPYMDGNFFNSVGRQFDSSGSVGMMNFTVVFHSRRAVRIHLFTHFCPFIYRLAAMRNVRDRRKDR